MKPQTPEELYTDNEDLADEGMLFIGDKGKILCDYRATKPRLIPQSRQRAFDGSVVPKDFDRTLPEDEWVNAIRNTTKSKGSFEQVAALAEAVTLAGIALRVPVQAAALGRAEDGVHQLDRGQRPRAAFSSTDKDGRRSSGKPSTITKVTKRFTKVTRI